MKPIKESSPKTRRKFDQTFKREAAQFSFCNFCGHQVVGGNEETMLR